ncbi:MAG TPA: DUF1217 domain-containing protein [Acetobacteraceae bacterium]|nr:DUF1217 domain-containing protein [Acetobacteraceae bacterium]
MSGAIGGIDYSVLFSPQDTSNTATAILNILDSAGTGTTASNFVSSGNPITDLTLAQQEESGGVAEEAQQPVVSQAVAAFKKAVANATSIQQALANPEVQQVLLTASGLSSYIGDTALVQKLFLSDPSDPHSLVNQFGDATWLATVQSYNFAKNGLSALQNPQVISTLTNAYAQVEWLQGLDQATPGLSNALTFLSQAGSITSVNDVLGNVVNFDVITGALGIPQEIVNQDITAQQQAISSRLNIADLQNRGYVTGLADQYLLSMQASNSSAAGSTDLTTLAVQAQGLIA